MQKVTPALTFLRSPKQSVRLRYLYSEWAIEVNVEIMQAFVRLRKMIASNKELARRLNELEKKYNRQFKVVFDTIRELMTPPKTPVRRIGFQREGVK